jgi:hypothetical protein
MEGDVLVNKWVFWSVVIVLVIILLYWAKSTFMKKEGMSDSDLMLRDRMMQLNLQADPRNSMRAVKEGMRVDPVLVAAALQ